MTTPANWNKHLTKVIVLCRSGYTTIMDLAKLAKKSLYTHPRTIIRTNVFSKKLKKRQLVPYADQTVLQLKTCPK
jgi:hypothetical protein